MSAAFAKYLARFCFVAGGGLAVVSCALTQVSVQHAAPTISLSAAPAALPAIAAAAAAPPIAPMAQKVIARVPARDEGAVDALRAAMSREVPGLLTPTPARQQRLLQLAQTALATADVSFIERPQAMLVVDRNPRAQEIWLVIARPDADAWDVVGGTKVSTGTTGRFDHYITPTGVFENTADILGYRAEGTYNENHIRGNGVKGMRVWDFGWQWAEKGWRADRERGQIRLEMHATDPANLAHLIGHTASSGCIRIPDALNRFLDRHGIIDADDERAAVTDIRFRALLLANRVPTPLAGNTVIVVDTGGGERLAGR